MNIKYHVVISVYSDLCGVVQQQILKICHLQVLVQFIC